MAEMARWAEAARKRVMVWLGTKVAHDGGYFFAKFGVFQARIQTFDWVAVNVYTAILKPQPEQNCPIIVASVECHHVKTLRNSDQSNEARQVVISAFSASLNDE